MSIGVDMPCPPPATPLQARPECAFEGVNRWQDRLPDSQTIYTFESGPSDVRASDALTLMNEQKINQLLIINDDKTLAGILTLHELLHAGVN